MLSLPIFAEFADSVRDAQGFLRYWRPAARAHAGDAREFVLNHAELFCERIDDLRDLGNGRLQQLHQGLPVIGAEFIVQMRDGQVECVFADSANGLASVNCIPRIAAPAETAELAVYAPAVLGNSGDPCLVWFVTSPEAYSLVDAHGGAEVCRISRIYDARNREVRNAEGTDSLPGPIARTEQDPPTGILEVDRAHQFLGDAYDFFFEHHGRDGIDGKGGTMRASIKVCITDEPCPYRNAVWTGTRILLGEGYAKDDIIAHELTHGFTDATSRLFYINESGALNESFSDMWGEWIDMSNGSPDDSPGVRWVIAEEFGGFRYMAAPPLRGDPDRYEGPNWWTASDDHGGVHTNSGVGNKLCYLLTDGDSFNGQTVAPLGLAKTADLMYEVQTKLLTRAASYHDFYAALGQAAINLGFSEAERAAVEAASIAVNIKPLPPAVTGFVATGNPATTTLELRWQNPPLASFRFVTIRRSSVDFPAALDQGDLVYSGTLQQVADTDLTPDNRYFYSIWADHGDAGVSIAAHTSAIAKQETPTQSFTEFFAGDFDLAHRSITFRPSNDIDRFAAFAESASDFPVDPWTGVPLPLGSNQFIEVQLADGASFPFYGVDYDSVFVSSNGFVTFGAGSADPSPTIADHFALPRVAAAWANLDPSIGSEVIYAEQLNDRVVVSWIGPPRKDTPDVNNFQIELFFSGEIRITWLWMDLPTALVGLSDGQGRPLNYFRSDLSSLSDGLRVTPMTIARSGHNLGLENIGNIPIDLAYTSSQPWLAVQGPASLAPGAAASLLATVESTPAPGVHDADIAITNLATGAVHHRSIRLDTRVPRPVIAEFLLDSDPGWAGDGAWAYGTPTGQGTANGDPSSAYTGDKVLGYNLDGDYPNNLAQPHYLTSEAIDCRHFQNVSLEFWVWHGIEGPEYDHASIQVSVDGETWVDVWTNPGGNRSDWAWHLETYDLPAIVDGEAEVRIRWGTGPTDGGLTFCGWNLDDIRLRGDPAANSAPVVQPLSITTFEDEAIDFAVVVEDAEGDAYSLSVGPASHGSATPTRYSPAPNYFGSDSFTIVAHDGRDSGSALVHVTILPVNDSPVFDPLPRLQIDEDTSGHFQPSATDIDGDPLEFMVAIDPREGVATATSYTPNPHFHGIDGFILMVSDGQGGFDAAAINILVRSVDDPPENLRTPQIQGLIMAGETLTADPGEWHDPHDDPPEVALDYAWLLDGAEIASGPNYTPDTSAIGRQLSLRVLSETTPPVTVGWQFQFGQRQIGMHHSATGPDLLPLADSASWEVPIAAESAISWAPPPVDFLSLYDRSGQPAIRLHEQAGATLSPGNYTLRYSPGISEIIVLRECWNLIGMPLQPLDPTPRALFVESWPAITPRVWRWENGEVVGADVLEPFTGYWIHSPRRVVARIEGLPIPFAKTIGPGWTSVSPAAAGAIPASWQETGPVLYWNRTRRSAISLDPRRGYWVHGGEFGRALMTAE